VPDAIAKLARIAEGATPDAVGLALSDIGKIAADVRWYYEEAAVELASVAPSARAAEAWIYEKTETGKVLLTAQAALRKSGLDPLIWFFLAPPDRTRAFAAAS